MSDHRKLAALRALAERPGTEAEGRVARAMLDRLEVKRHADTPEGERSIWAVFEAHLRGEMDTYEFLAKMREHAERGLTPDDVEYAVRSINEVWVREDSPDE